MLSEFEAGDIVVQHFRDVMEMPLQGGYDDPELAVVFHRVEADVDGDGVPETWLVGGIPSPMSAVSALLVVRELAGTRQIVPVVPLREGWQELEIADLDHDGRTEVWTTWQVGSGGYLSVLVHRWDGEQVTLAMSHENAYQGAVERKNVDGTPADDIVVWTSVGHGGSGPWHHPVHYVLTVHRWTTAGVWQPATVFPTRRRYLPDDVSTPRTGPMNLPKSLDLLLVPLEQDRVRLLGALADGQPEAVVDEIAQRVDTYFEQNQPAEALRRIDLLLSVLDRLPASRPWSAMLYSQRARALLELGRVGDARSTYRQAIDGLPESATSGAFACSLRRADGMLAAVLGDFEEALAILEDAQDQLPQNGVTDGTRLAVERARLLSNIALARYWLGDLETSAAGFGAVIELEQASGNVDGEVVNRSLLGNVLRDSGRATDALEQYDAALATLDERSYRDRESDVLSDRALALLTLDRPAEALDDGRTAMLLSGPTNYALNGGRHLIAYAEALAAAGLPDAAHAVATQAYGMSRRWESLDLEWRAALVAARTAGGKDDTAERFRWLERALASVESLRTQSLPESLKIVWSVPDFIDTDLGCQVG